MVRPEELEPDDDGIVVELESVLRLKREMDQFADFVKEIPDEWMQRFWNAVCLFIGDDDLLRRQYDRWQVTSDIATFLLHEKRFLEAKRAEAQAQ